MSGSAFLFRVTICEESSNDFRRKKNGRVQGCSPALPTWAAYTPDKAELEAGTLKVRNQSAEYTGKETLKCKKIYKVRESLFVE